MSRTGKRSSPTSKTLSARCVCAPQYREEGGHWRVDGDPMEGALVSLAIKAGFERRELDRAFVRLDEVPFDAEHRFMATLHRYPQGGAILYVKGAPERVLEMCGAEW